MTPKRPARRHNPDGPGVGSWVAGVGSSKPRGQTSQWVRPRTIRSARHWIVPALLVLTGCGGDDPERLLNTAKQSWTAGRHAEAEDSLARLARVRPLTITERLFRAQVARDRGRVDEAVAVLGEPAEGAPAGERALLLSTRGTLDLLRHRFRNAEGAFTKALDLDPKRTEARRELIHLYSLQGRPADAAGQFRPLTDTLTFADAYFLTVGRREDVGPAELVDALRPAVANDPEDRASRLALADNLRRLGRLDDAEKFLRPLPADDPDARVARARVALDRGDPAGAESALGVPAGNEPPSVARMRARIALDRGDAAAARRSIESARKGGDDRETLFTLGQALRLSGDPAGARPFLDTARQLEALEQLVQNARPQGRRDDPLVLRAIGDACLAARRGDQARAWYRLALARSPLDLDLQKVLFQLNK